MLHPLLFLGMLSAAFGQVLPQGERWLGLRAGFAEAEISPGPGPTPFGYDFRGERTSPGNQYVMWSHGTHPVVLGKTSPVISADFPGRACELIQQYLPDTKAMFFMAAAGHSQPWISTQEDPARIEPVARAAASFVALLCEGTRSAGPPKIAVAHGTVASGGGKLPLTVARIGEVRLMAVPVELFEELALDLRRRADGPVFLMTLANGWCEYLPHRAAFEEGGYEVDAARAKGYHPGDGEALVEALLRLDRSLPR